MAEGWEETLSIADKKGQTRERILFSPVPLASKRTQYKLERERGRVGEWDFNRVEGGRMGFQQSLSLNNFGEPRAEFARWYTRHPVYDGVCGVR
jgi:hypothetical protein